MSVAKMFKMTDAVWRRHANPWSVWTRVPVFPLFAFAVWSRVWIGWGCLVPIILLILWAWFNPRFFGEPKSFKSWASRAVLGEQIWVNRKEKPIQEHHNKIITLLMVPQYAGTFLSIWGLAELHFWATFSGISIMLFGKMWFLDRMVWIYEESRSK